MNFLLHHHLALRDLGRPEAAAGAMLPDVWRMADRRARARSREPGADGGLLDPVSQGVGHHLAVDTWFHRAAVFTEGETATREALRQAREAPKMGLFAHVAWELCLDGALLRRIGTESVLREVRVSIAAVRPDGHRRAADLHTAVPPPRPRHLRGPRRSDPRRARPRAVGRRLRDRDGRRRAARRPADALRLRTPVRRGSRRGGGSPRGPGARRRCRARRDPRPRGGHGAARVRRYGCAPIVEHANTPSRWSSHWM